MTEPRWLTPEQIVDRLHMSQVTITDDLCKGRLKGYRMGKFWRITEEDLDAFIEGSTAEDQPTRRRSMRPWRIPKASPMSRRAGISASRDLWPGAPV